MPTCCQIPPQGEFLESLQHDALEYAKYVSGEYIPSPTILHNKITSALHLEMKLWRDKRTLPCGPYSKNQAEYNSWRAMSNRTTAPDSKIQRFVSKEKAEIFESINNAFNNLNGCFLIDFDLAILELLKELRSRGVKNQESANNPDTEKPGEISTIGLAQKLVNVYLKYELCWSFVEERPNNAIPKCANVNPQSVLCALHAPLDGRFLKIIRVLPIGQHLKKNLTVYGDSIRIQQADGEFRPWSKMECLRTYFGIQLLFRRIAISTWPKGCQCEVPDGMSRLTAELPQIKNGPDWIQLALNIDNGSIKETVDALGELPDALGELPKPKGNFSSKPKKVSKVSSDWNCDCLSCKLHIEGLWHSLTANDDELYPTPTGKSSYVVAEKCNDSITITTKGGSNVPISKQAFVNVLHFLRSNNHTVEDPCEIRSNNNYEDDSPLGQVARLNIPGNPRCITYILPIMNKFGIVGIDKKAPTRTWTVC